MKREAFIEQAADAGLVVAVQGNRLAWRSQGALSDDLISALYLNERLLVRSLQKSIAYQSELRYWREEVKPFDLESWTHWVSKAVHAGRSSHTFAAIHAADQILPLCKAPPCHRFFPEKSPRVDPKAQGDEMALTNDFGGEK